MTGHTEVVRVVFEPTRVTFRELLRLFWENHDPTQGMQQGADVGTQYRSAVYTFSEEQQRQAQSSRLAYQRAIAASGLGVITTEIAPAPAFYFAEAYHQQYLAKNPAGYCGHGGTGIACPADGFGAR
jgi:peptide-methionine (S)-S-oxide reductase